MLKTLNKSNNDIAIITENLKSVSEKLNKGKALWNLINDSMLTSQIKSSINKINTSTNKINDLLDNTNSIVKDVKKGKGSIGLLLYDTILSKNIQNSAFNLEATSNKTSEISSSLKSLTENLKNDIEDGNGIIHLILKDSLVKKDLTESIIYIKKDSKGINEIIDAIKKSILFRRYFKKKDMN
jgi:phospholipid/cholesterol/gamma-HCH transport system substrate-binding protein